MLRIPLLISNEISPSSDLLPNGLRYLLVGGMRKHYFVGINFKPRKMLENAQTPTSQVHAMLGAGLL
jgi:hypothetical protein